MDAKRKLILASSSRAREALLLGAGLSFEKIPANIDENVTKDRFVDHPEAAMRIAETLAVAKAEAIAGSHLDACVIGADQTLSLDGRLFDKPRDRDEARDHLRALRGRSHELISSVAVVADGKTAWTHSARAELRMREFSDAFLERYLDRVGDDVFTSVGGYRLEGPGAQLFERIDGHYFTILGLPLLALLDCLRETGIVER